MSGSRFVLIGPAGDDIFGIWDARSADMAFGPSLEPDEDVWRVELPADGRAALADRWRAIDAAERATEESASRLAEFIRSGCLVPVDFSGRGTAEDELRSALEFHEAMPDFGIGSGWFSGGRESIQEVLDFFARATRWLSGVARIETVVGGAIVARSEIGAFGSTQAVWCSGLDSERAQTHLGAVEIALATRRAWIRLAGVLLGGAAELVALATSGIGWLVALPAVWRFVRRVLAEVRRLPVSATL
jgi:hypothetical protein